ncbi:MAG: IclR family transcriptional regulator [Pseudomonadota bacterium]
MSGQKVEAVERALAILGAFATGKPGLSLAELAAATGFYKSTILRLAGSLEGNGYLLRDAGGEFRLGPTLGRLGALYRTGFNLEDVIRPELRRVVEATGETASFYVRQGDVRICLFRENSPHSARHHLDEGVQLPLSAGASAHVLLAYSDAKRTKSKKSVLERGHYVSLGERDAHVAAVSVPVFDAGEHFRGALAASGLISRFNEKKRQQALSELRAAAQRLRSVLSATE